MKENIHIVKHPTGWAAKKEGAKRAAAIHSTQAAAIKYGRALAKKHGGELVIHAEDGKIRESDTEKKTSRR